MKCLMKCDSTLLPLPLSSAFAIGYQLLCRSLSSSSSTDQRKWNPKTSVIITNPTLFAMESCATMLEMKQIQAQMTRTGLITDTFPASRVLAFCALADSGDIRYAHAFFNQIEKPKTYMWNTMIRGYLKAQFPEKGFSFFGQMVREGVEMDRLSFVWVLKACGNFPGISKGNLVHCAIWKMGFDIDLLVRNGLIHYYADRGCLLVARKVFDESSVRDVVTWTTLIDGYTARDCLDKATQVFDSILLSNVKPNEVTMIAMLSACSSKGDMRMGKRIYYYITMENVNCSLNLLNATLDMFVKCGLLIEARKIFDNMKTKDVFSWTSMVNGYAKWGDLDSARSFFVCMLEKNVISWTAMIAGYSQNNQPKEALKLFQDMMKAGLFPIENTLVCVISACGQLGCLDLGQWVHRCCINPKGVQQSVILSNALIDMYAKSGGIHTAASLFNEMPLRNLVSWNTMIGGYASHGYAKQALILFEQMKQSGFEPDSITFVAVLSACSHGGLVSEGREYFKSMIRDYKLEPREEHYACMIDLLGRIGLLDEAYHLITNMPMLPCESAWGALLSACRMHGNVELAKLSAHKLLEMDPQDSGIYVLLANTLANNKRWADVRRVRSKMREMGVKKSPGRSLIEIEGEFHEFLAGDDSHPRSKEIYKIINNILLLSDLRDYIP
ncbi:pentatricopeptide repeat-containing protein At2g22410, mitochondrial-like [Humulus lupulus]|uniref:pentatricopeptide repeat-containing protein At2g22410, mitochondrial-like n=1 Tax=Humulus lupulus TaxID=3486 RepID=UPI002B411A3F|nr:pentatricopeptide repeat-containing protein At2g22410, mitochondrial-like [Humulus lupulus]